MKKIVSFSIFFFLFLFSSCNSQIRHGSIQVSNIKFLNDKESTTIPFERYKGWIVLKVKVNDVKVFSFLLDTGAPIAVFGEGVTTNDLNLNITGQVAVRGEGNGSQKEVPFATNVKFTLGDVEINNASMAVGMPTDVLTGVDGIIGKCIFENAVVAINWEESTLTLTQKDKFQYTGSGSILPLYLLNSGHIATDIVMENGAKKFTTKAVVDLGNRSATFADNSNASMLMEGNGLLKDIIVGWGATGPVTGDVGRTNVLLGRDFTFSKVPVAFRKMGESFSQQGVNSNIGIDILSKFNLVFDYPGNRLILEKNESYSSEFIFNQSGIIINPKREGDYLLVAGIIPFSPAEEAGIKEGDKITIANGLAAELKNLSRLSDIISGKKSADLELILKRDGSIIKKKIKARKLI